MENQIPGEHNAITDQELLAHQMMLKWDGADGLEDGEIDKDSLRNLIQQNLEGPDAQEAIENLDSTKGNIVGEKGIMRRLRNMRGHFKGLLLALGIALSPVMAEGVAQAGDGEQTASAEDEGKMITYNEAKEEVNHAIKNKNKLTLKVKSKYYNYYIKISFKDDNSALFFYTCNLKDDEVLETSRMSVDSSPKLLEKFKDDTLYLM